MNFDHANELKRDSKLTIEYLQSIGALCSKVLCICGTSMKVYRRTTLTDEFCFQCTKSTCKKRKSIRVDSWFEGSHIPLRTMFFLIYMQFEFPRILNIDITRMCDLSENSITQWKYLVREAITAYFLKYPLVLGKCNAVQIDESLIGGKKKYHRGSHHQHEIDWVFGMIEENTNLCVMWVVDDRKKETLVNLIKQHIYPGATIKSDQFASYKSLTAEGFHHQSVNHSVEFVTKDGVHTQNIEALWSRLKSPLKSMHGTSANMLPGYLDFHSFMSLARFEGRTAMQLFFEKCITNFV